MTTPTDIQLPHGSKFAEKWAEWIKYRKEIKKPLKSSMAISRCLNQLDVVSEVDAIEMINHSIRNQYQGIFPLNNQKEETSKTLSPPKFQKPSTYEAKPFDRATGIAHMKETLKKNFEQGSFIHDWGGVYTVLLIEKCQMLIPGSVKEDITKEVEHEATRTRNRFEEQYSGSMESDIRNGKLNWFLDYCRKQGRDISLEI